MTTSQISSFVERLSQIPSTAIAYNQYAHGNIYNDIRRANLTRYFQDMAERKPAVLLLMEAPGYRGNRLTGLPVTSRKLLLEGVPSLEMLGVQRGYQDVPEPEFSHIQSEQSATIMWQTLQTIGYVPMIWSSFPFHPHLEGQSLTNRKPLKTELQIGKPFVRDVLDIFTPQHVIAVGNVGDEMLNGLNVPHRKVRHPAQGGKNDFVAGITQFFSSFNNL